MKILSRTPPLVLVLLAIGSVQLGAAFAKSLFAALGPMTVVFLRLALAALVLLLLVRPNWSALRAAQWRITLGFGAILALMNLSYYLALQRLPLGLTVTIEFIGPLSVALWHSRRALDFVWVLLAAGGIALLNPFGGEIDAQGFWLALAAGACWAAYIVLGEKLGGTLPGAQGLSLAMTVGAVLLMPVGVHASDAIATHYALLPVAFAVAILSSALPYSCEIEALRRMPKRVFGILMSLEPAVAALIGFVVLHEVLSKMQILAIVMVMIASYGTVKFGQSNDAASTDL
jgi:inner membrane transporter RhtA